MCSLHSLVAGARPPHRPQQQLGDWSHNCRNHHTRRLHRGAGEAANRSWSPRAVSRTTGDTAIPEAALPNKSEIKPTAAAHSVRHDEDVDDWRQRLFPERHIDDLWSDPLLILYIPFGLVLAGTRMLLWVMLLAIDSPALTNSDGAIRFLQLLLGVSVTWENIERLPRPEEGRHVMVSNHVTAGDLITLYSLPRRYIHLITPAMPTVVTKVKNHRVELRHATPDVYESLATKEDNADEISHPVHLFPEGGMTNGSGMIRFSRGFVRFSRAGLPVVPMAMRVDMPFFGINTHTLTSSFLANLFWFCFAPRLEFTCKVLDPLTMHEGETAAQFALRVQGAIAEELQLPVSDVTIQAKRQMVQAAKEGRNK